MLGARAGAGPAIGSYELVREPGRGSFGIGLAACERRAGLELPVTPRVLAVTAAAVSVAACTHDFTVTPGDDAPLGACDPPYELRAIGDGATSSCYRFVAARATWLDAERDCEDDAPDAHLVVIDSVPEHDTVHALGSDVWVAFTDRVSEGAMTWVTDGGIDPFDNPCFFGADQNGPGEDCVIQGANACPDWFYQGCDALHAYVCERDGQPANVTRY